MRAPPAVPPSLSGGTCRPTQSAAASRILEISREKFLCLNIFLKKGDTISDLVVIGAVADGEGLERVVLLV